MKQYVQTDLEADRQAATTLAELIIGGSLVSTEIGASKVWREQALAHKPHAEGRPSVRGTAFWAW